MSLQITVKSTDRDLATTGIMRQMILGATSTSTGLDQQFSDNIRRSSRWAETRIGQPLTVQTYREAVPGYGRRNLMLSRTPVRQIIAVYDATDTGTATQLQTSEFRIQNEEAGLISRDMGFAWSPALMGHWGVPAIGGDAVPLELTPLSGQESEPWLVDYVAGWSYGGIDTGSANWSTGVGTTSTDRTLPEDVEEAVAIKAQAFYEGADEPQSEKLGDLEVNYRSLGMDNGRLVTRADALLEPYRRIV